MTYVLIQAGEGETGSIYFGSTRRELLEDLEYVLSEDEYLSTKDKVWVRRQRFALIQMLDGHKNWNVGRYKLSPVFPIWEEWTLFISV